MSACMCNVDRHDGRTDTMGIQTLLNLEVFLLPQSSHASEVVPEIQRTHATC